MNIREYLEKLRSPAPAGRPDSQDGSARSEQSAQVAPEYREANDWESSHIEMVMKSEKIAWSIAKGASAIAIVTIIALIVLLPLKEVQPYLIRVDKSTGHTDIVTMLKEDKVSIDESVDKYWLSEFVQARETWEWYTAQSNYDRVRVMSSPSVFADYGKYVTGPNGIDKKFSSRGVVRVNIISVVPLGNGQGTVRYSTITKDREASDADGQTRTWVATIGYEYKLTAKLNEKERNRNPLGFQVLSYRRDAETSAVPSMVPAAGPAPEAGTNTAPAPTVPAIN